MLASQEVQISELTERLRRQDEVIGASSDHVFEVS